MQAVRDLPKVSPYLHVPAQSGSNRVLRRMRRGYTAESYREMIEQIRQIVPGGGGDQRFHRRLLRRDGRRIFKQTVELVRWARFKNSFIFKYSPRPGTKAAELYADDVPEDGQAAAEQRAVGGPERDQPGGQPAAFWAARWRSWSRGRASRPGSTADRRRRGAIGGPDGLRPHRGVRRPAAMDRPAVAGDD